MSITLELTKDMPQNTTVVNIANVGRNTDDLVGFMIFSFQKSWSEILYNISYKFTWYILFFQIIHHICNTLLVMLIF